MKWDVAIDEIFESDLWAIFMTHDWNWYPQLKQKGLCRRELPSAGSSAVEKMPHGDYYLRGYGVCGGTSRYFMIPWWISLADATQFFWNNCDQCLAPRKWRVLLVENLWLLFVERICCCRWKESELGLKGKIWGLWYKALSLPPLPTVTAALIMILMQYNVQHVWTN